MKRRQVTLDLRPHPLGSTLEVPLGDAAHYPPFVAVIKVHPVLRTREVPAPVLGFARRVSLTPGQVVYRLPLRAWRVWLTRQRDWSPGWRDIHGDGLMLTELALAA